MLVMYFLKHRVIAAKAKSAVKKAAEAEKTALLEEAKAAECAKVVSKARKTARQNWALATLVAINANAEHTSAKKTAA